MFHIKKVRTVSIILAVSIALLSMSGCLRYLTQDRSEVLLEAVDIDQTLQIAESYLLEKEGRWGSSLGIWAIRDQHVTPQQAGQVSTLYHAHIGRLRKSFDVWHLTWAIANMYKLGNDEVKGALQGAYDDARARAKAQGGSADKMVNGEKMYMGDAHGGGRAFARRHVVVPGNKRYVQSYEEYAEKQKKKK